MNSTYTSGSQAPGPTEKPCLNCGTPTTQTLPEIRGKAYVCNNCQNQETEQAEEEVEDVVFEKTQLERIVENIKNCQSCQVNDPRDTDNPDQDLCPECCADWNWYQEQHSGEVEA